MDKSEQSGYFLLCIHDSKGLKQDHLFDLRLRTSDFLNNDIYGILQILQLRTCYSLLHSIHIYLVIAYKCHQILNSELDLYKKG